MKTTTLLSVVAALCICHSTKATEAELSDSTAVQRLNDIEVVATRASDSTPIAFTNLTSQQIAKANTGLDLPYLLQATPSVVTTSDAGAGVGYTSIRVRGTDGSRINVTANGIPVNDAESHNVYWVNIPDLASSLKDIQIQRGAGTSTNGAGAFGASINMQTDTPGFDPYAGFDGTYGMYNTNKQTLRIGTGMLDDHWSIDARLSHISSDGYIDRASTRLWSYFTQGAYYRGGTSLKLIAFGGKERTYNAWDYATKQQIQEYGRRYNPCGEYTDSDGKTAYYPDQYDNYAQHNFQLILNQQVSQKWHLNLGLHYTKGDGYYEQYKTSQKFKKYALKPFIDGDKYVDRSDLIRQKHMDNDFTGAVFSLKYLNKGIAAILGGGLNHYNGHHFGQISWIRNYIGPLDPLQEYYRNVAHKTDANIYARANMQMTKSLTGYIDLQYRHINYKINGIGDNYDDAIASMEHLDIHRIFDFFNPKIGLDYSILTNERVYGSFSVAHREPTRDNFIDCAPGREPVAERLFDYELGYEHRGTVFSAGLNLYYMDYKDQLVPTGRLSDTGNAVSENVAASYRMGAEIFWTLKPLKWFDWHFTTTLSRNRIKDFTEYIYGDAETLTINRKDTPIAYSPTFMLNNTFNFTFGRFDASLQTRYVGSQYLTNTGSKDTMLDAYCVTDLHLGYDLTGIAGLKDVRIGLVAYNLLSEKYENNGWAYSYYYLNDKGQKIVGQEAGYAVQAPAHVMGTISIKF